MAAPGSKSLANHQDRLYNTRVGMLNATASQFCCKSPGNAETKSEPCPP